MRKGSSMGFLGSATVSGEPPQALAPALARAYRLLGGSVLFPRLFALANQHAAFDNSPRTEAEV